MEKKNLLFVAAAMVMAGCASDDMIGDNAATQSDNQVIGFNMSTPAMTRGSSSDATKLGNMFIVWGEKNESGKSESKFKVDVNSDNADLVFKNYRVDYKTNTANTTLSNTADWEYVGVTSFGSKVTPNAPTSQTIKYWDMNATDYTFTAVSAPDDEVGSKIKITKITEGNSTDANAVYDKGYTIELADAGASVGHIYVADREHLTSASDKQSGTISNTAVNKYGGQVKLTFRNFQSKIRFGIYEKVPGYKVVITGIKYNTDASTEVAKTATTDVFGITGDFVKAGGNTKYTVTYRSDTGHEGEAQVEIADGAEKSTYMTTDGTTWLNTTKPNYVGTEATTPTWDNKNANSTDGDYTAILPNTKNQTNLKLKIAYKLVSEDTGEEITFKDASNNEIYRTVEVPAAYCQWKSNYAYTYLFKITDKSAELYPITFDAVVVDNQIGNQETITEVSDPSITTYAVKSDGKTVVTDQNEYQGKNIIYASVVENSNPVTLKLTTTSVTDGNIRLYTVSLANGVTGYDITEASVANAISQKSNVKLTYTDVTGESYVSVTSSNDKVPAEDGTKRDISALKWTATANTTYAIEYTSNSKTYYKIVKVGAAE